MKNVRLRLTEISTPRRFVLRALYFGRPKPHDIFIYVHGLSASLFARTALLESLADRQTGVLAFNNRGSGIVSKVRRHKASGYESVTIGAAHEVFTDCVDDLDGAVRWARTAGAKNIYLVGHSTGCQKSVYYLSRRPQSPVKGAILLAPVSDYAITKTTSKQAYIRALACARKMMRAGKRHELMPAAVWPEILDAQRWLSLYTPDSPEEIFSYATGRRPAALLKNRKPILAVLAEQDEFWDRPATAVAAWFRAVLAGRSAQVKIIKGAPHGFDGHFPAVKRVIKDWARPAKK